MPGVVFAATFELGNDLPTSLAVGEEGAIYIGSSIGPGQTVRQHGANDGELVWSRRVPSGEFESGCRYCARESIAVAAAPGGGVLAVANQWKHSLVAARVSPDGSTLWSRELGLPKYFQAVGIVGDDRGVVVVASTSASGPVSQTSTVVLSNSGEILATRYRTDGALARQLVLYKGMVLTLLRRPGDVHDVQDAGAAFVEAADRSGSVVWRHRFETAHARLVLNDERLSVLEPRCEILAQCEVWRTWLSKRGKPEGVRRLQSTVNVAQWGTAAGRDGALWSISRGAVRRYQDEQCSSTHRRRRAQQVAVHDIRFTRLAADGTVDYHGDFQAAPEIAQEAARLWLGGLSDIAASELGPPCESQGRWTPRNIAEDPNGGVVLLARAHGTVRLDEEHAIEAHSDSFALVRFGK